MMEMYTTRRDLAQIEVALSHARDDEKVERARAEQRAIAAADGNYGKNETDRQRHLTLAVAEDKGYLAAQRRVRELEGTCARIKAHLAGYEDERRAAEWQIRQQLVAALLKRCATAEDGDRAFDQAADAEVDSDFFDRTPAHEVYDYPF